MPLRLDVLTGAPSRRALFPASLLSTDDDPVLQALVREAADQLRAPIALVSLVMDRVQLFRAQVGLPPDLAAARATDRDISFCQLVVRDEQPLKVEDAQGDGRVPQMLVQTHAVRAYLGAPIRVDQDVLGSLCVIDGAARAFSAEDQALLESLAARASARCAELVAAASGSRAVQRVSATQDAFPELRNQLLVLQSGIAEAQYERAQLAPVVRSCGPSGAAVHAQAAAALRALEDRLSESLAAAEQIAAQVVALETVLAVRRVPADLDAALVRAGSLARHLTTLLAGVDLPAPAAHAPLQASQATAVAVLTNAIREIGWRALEHGGSGVRIAVHREDAPGAVQIGVRAGGLGAAELGDAVEAVSFTAERLDGVVVGHASGALWVRFSLG